MVTKPPSAIAQPAVVLVLAILVGYVVIARGIGNLYPFSTYSMYSGLRARTASRIVARESSGALHEVSTYESWHCDHDPDDVPGACGLDSTPYSIGYLDREHREWIAQHRGNDPSAQPVDVVRHIWFLDVAEPHTTDCVLAHCRAFHR